MKLIHVPRLIAALLVGAALAACASQMEPAKKLIADVEASVAAAGADAQQYVPEHAAAVAQKLADLKAAFDKQDYKTVIAGAPALLTEAKGLADEAAAKKKEVLEALNTQWTALAASLPQALAAAEASYAAVAKAKKLPKGVTKEAVTEAGTLLGDAKSAWSEATAAFGSGNVQGALDKAKAVKAKIDEATARIGSGAAKPAG
jgi:hypothetical protein